jgi:PTS system nitrogen regulatory IIA component
VRAHLHLLSRIAFALRDPRFREVVSREGTRDEILAEALRVESALGGPSGGERAGSAPPTRESRST